MLTERKRNRVRNRRGELYYRRDEEAESTRSCLEGNLRQILAEWKDSRDELNFPEVVDFKNGQSLLSLSKKTVAGALLAGLQKKEMLIAVDQTGHVKESCKIIEIYPKEGDTVCIALFFNRSFQRNSLLYTGEDPKLTLKQNILRMVCLDAIFTAEHKKRAIHRVPLSQYQLVGIYNGGLEFSSTKNPPDGGSSAANS